MSAPSVSAKYSLSEVKNCCGPVTLQFYFIFILFLHYFYIIFYHQDVYMIFI